MSPGLVFSEILSANVVQRMRIEHIVGLLCQFGIGVVDEHLAPDRERQHHRAVAALCGDLVEQLGVRRRHHVVERLAVVGDKRVPVHQAADAVGGAVGDAGDDHAAVAVAHQHDVAQIVAGEVIDDRVDGFVQPGLLGIAWPVAGDSWRVDLMAGRADRRRRRFEFFAGMPRAVNEDVSRHRNSSQKLLFCYARLCRRAKSTAIRRSRKAKSRERDSIESFRENKHGRREAGHASSQSRRSAAYFIAS